MKICIFVHSLKPGGGVQQVTSKLVAEWVGMGCKVTIVCPSRGEGGYIRLPAEVNVVEIAPTKTEKLRNIVFLLIPLFRFFKKNKDYDVVLCNEAIYTLVVSIVLMAARSSIPLIGVAHGTYSFVGGVKQCMVSLFSRVALNMSSFRVSAFAGVCNAVEKDIKNALLRKNKIKLATLYNPVIDNVSFELKLAASMTKADLGVAGRKMVVCIGRLHKQKGFDILIQAAKLCDPEVVFFIIGEGEERTGLVDMVKKNNLSDRVRFVGYEANVFNYLNIADCFCLPSRWEGFGVVLVEALFAQAPIVSFDCPHGPLEILKGGDYGSLVERNDHQELARQIQKKINDERRENIRWRDFNSKECAEKYLDLFKSVAR